MLIAFVLFFVAWIAYAITAVGKAAQINWKG